jgi:hypothetical protein
MRNLFFRFAESIKNVLTFVFSGTLFFFAAPLQADPHHDGVILAPAIAFAEGLPVQSGAFSQYGPLSPILSGLWIKLTEPSLVSLRYLAAIQAVMIAISLFFVLKLVTTEKRARLLTILWVFTSGIWSTRFPGALMAWPSLISTLLLMVALLLCISGIRSKTRRSDIQILLVGVLISTAGFARAQSWAIAGAVGLTLLFTNYKNIKKLLLLCLGYIFGLVAMLAFVIRSQSLESWWLQSIYWPTQIYPAVGRGNNYNRFQMVLYLIEGLVLIFLILLAGIIVKKFTAKVGTLFIIICTLASLGIGYFVPTLTSVPIRYRVLFGEPFERILVSPFYLSALAAVFLAIQQLKKRSNEKDPVIFLVSIFGCISIIQLYPQSDIMHLWWIAPLLIPSLIILLEKVEKIGKIEKGVSDKILLIFSVFGLAFALNFIFSDWTEFKNPALAGTYASADKVNGLLVYDDIVKNAIPKKSSFDCHDGIYSVLSGEYLPVDEWYVSWGFPKTITPELGEIRFICGKSYDYAESEARRIGWNLTEFNQSKSNPEASLAILRKP